MGKTLYFPVEQDGRAALAADRFGEGNGQMKRSLQGKAAQIGCAIMLFAMESVLAQGGGSLTVGNLAPVQDALGRNLPGSNGNPDGTAVWIEIREATGGGGIVPPDPATGEGDDVLNPLVRESYMGHDTVGTNPGLFAETFETRLSTNAMYYARAYDAPTPGAAIYYVDSAVFAGPPSFVTSVNVEFGSMLLVETGAADGDTDGDGIPDAMETEMLGTSPSQPDTDGDYYNDFFEATHTDVLNPTEPNIPFEINRAPEYAGGGSRSVSWGANPGLEYRLEFRPAWVDGGGYSNVWSGTAAETNLEIDVQTWVQTNSPKGFFRVVVP